MNVHRVLLLLIVATISLAHGTEYIYTLGDISYTAQKPSDCFEISSHAIAECVNHFFEESEKELNTAFDSIRGRLVQHRQLFEETQANWISFKNSECEVRSVSAQAFSDPERQKWLMVRACTAELNAQRILQLEGLALGCDSCLQ